MRNATLGVIAAVTCGLAVLTSALRGQQAGAVQTQPGTQLSIDRGDRSMAARPLLTYVALRHIVVRHIEGSGWVGVGRGRSG